MALYRPQGGQDGREVRLVVSRLDRVPRIAPKPKPKPSFSRRAELTMCPRLPTLLDTVVLSRASGFLGSESSTSESSIAWFVFARPALTMLLFQ